MSRHQTNDKARSSPAALGHIDAAEPNGVPEALDADQLIQLRDFFSLLHEWEREGVRRVN